MAIRDIAELGTILSIWAHPDDEAYLCGGIMAVATAAGSRVVCVTATRGELGITDAARWPAEQLAAIREAELAESLRILGVSDHRWLGYPDGGCAGLDPEQPTQQVADLLREIHPDTVLTFARDGQTGHPDHIAVHHWTREAVRRTGIGTLHVSVNTQESLDQNLARFLELGVIVGDQPVAWIDPLSIQLELEPAVLDRKLAALAAQASQTEAFRAAAGEDYYRQLVATERFGRLVPR
jgi:LmbE family N-acetylglucosaminyl deacetylase